MTRKPGPPFDRWPVQHFDPSFGYAWWCGRGIVVSHVIVHRATGATSRAFLSYEESTVKKHADEVAQSGGLFVVHDFRMLEGYDSDARRIYQDHIRERPKGQLRGAVVCVNKVAPLLRMALQGTNLVATLVHGAKIELTTDLEGALQKYDVPIPKP
jgi:hypothetical protein